MNIIVKMTDLEILEESQCNTNCSNINIKSEIIGKYKVKLEFYQIELDKKYIYCNISIEAIEGDLHDSFSEHLDNDCIRRRTKWTEHVYKNLSLHFIL